MHIAEHDGLTEEEEMHQEGKGILIHGSAAEAEAEFHIVTDVTSDLPGRCIFAGGEKTKL